jgi:hypothetical protein
MHTCLSCSFSYNIDSLVVKVSRQHIQDLGSIPLEGEFFDFVKKFPPYVSSALELRCPARHPPVGSLESVFQSLNIIWKATTGYFYVLLKLLITPKSACASFELYLSTSK